MSRNRHSYRDNVRNLTEAPVSIQRASDFADAYEDIPAIAALLDERGIIHAVSRQCEKHFGDAGRFVGRSLVSLAHSDDRGKLVNALRDALTDRDTITHCEFRIYRGAKMPLRLQLSLRAASRDSGPSLLLAVASDVSDRVRIENQLLKRTSELSDMAGKLLAAQDHERRRIAADMHDTVGHHLALAKFQVDGLRHLQLDEPARASIDSARELLQEAIDAVRSLTFSLNSSSLEDNGLDAAIEDFGQSLSLNNALQFGLSSRPRQRRLGKEGRIMLYRVVRELLVNAVKHARATQLRVSIGSDDEYLHFAVIDNGIGIRPGSLQKASGTGLRSVSQQIEDVNGVIAIEARDGGGTQVRFSVPYAVVGQSR